MLRSIFSLIQNIIDSDKEFNNKKSNTVIYLVSTPDDTFNMDLEIDGKPRQNLKSIKLKKNEVESDGSFKVTTERGDTVTCKHHTEKKIVPKKANTIEDEKLSKEYAAKVEKISERASFSNDNEITGERDVEEELKKFEGGNEPTVHELLTKLPQKQIKMLQKDKDQISALMEQIQKMKVGMERLQEIAQQFNTSDQFKKDVEFLTKNVPTSLKASDAEGKDLEKSSSQ